MLVTSSQRYIPVTINTLVLSRDDRYFYVHRDVYDQAVILSDGHYEYDTLAGLVTRSSTNDIAARWFYENAPKPICILAPYLNLIDGRIEQDMELCCGVLHVITTMINVRNFIVKPVEVRKSVTFSLAIKEEYEMAWDRFFMTAIPYSQVVKQVDRTLTGVDTPTITTKLDGYSANQDDRSRAISLVSTDSERDILKKMLQDEQ